MARSNLPHTETSLPGYTGFWDDNTHPTAPRACWAFGVKKNGYWGLVKHPCYPQQNSIEDCTKLCEAEGDSCQAIAYNPYDWPEPSCALSNWPLGVGGIDLTRNASGSVASGSSETSSGSGTSGGESTTSTTQPSETETQEPTFTTAQSSESGAPEHMATTTQTSEVETKDSTSATTQISETSDEPTTTATGDELTGTSTATTTSAESTSTAAGSKTCPNDINAPGYCEYRKSLPTQKVSLPGIMDHWPQSDGDVEPPVQRTCNAFGVKKGGWWGRTRQGNPKQNTMEDCAQLCREEGNCEAFGLYTFDVQMEGGYTCALSTYKLATEGIEIDVQWSFWWNDLDCFDCYDCNK